MNMKKLVFLSILLLASHLFAQTQSDSLLIKQIPAIQTSIENLMQEIEELSLKIESQDSFITKLSDSLFFCSASVNDLEAAQEESSSKLINQQKSINLQRQSISEITDAATRLENAVDSLSSLIETNRTDINSISHDLGTKIQETGQNAETRISELGGDVEMNRLYWLIATLVTLLLGGLMYLFLGKRIKSSQTDLESQIRNTKKSLEEESLKLDGELVKVFQKQLEVLENSPKGASQNEDHALVLKIADRLTAMETNHYRMDPGTKGLKQLKNAVKSIKENYLAKGYEIVEMLELEYKEGMNVTANFIPSDKVEKGKRIITRVIKPQVNFNGKMIQSAQIEVSIGE